MSVILDFTDELQTAILQVKLNLSREYERQKLARAKSLAGQQEDLDRLHNEVEVQNQTFVDTLSQVSEDEDKWKEDSLEDLEKLLDTFNQIDINAGEAEHLLGVEDMLASDKSLQAALNSVKSKFDPQHLVDRISGLDTKVPEKKPWPEVAPEKPVKEEPKPKVEVVKKPEPVEEKQDYKEEEQKNEEPEKDEGKKERKKKPVKEKDELEYKELSSDEKERKTEQKTEPPKKEPPKVEEKPEPPRNEVEEKKPKVEPPKPVAKPKLASDKALKPEPKVVPPKTNVPKVLPPKILDKKDFEKKLPFPKVQVPKAPEKSVVSPQKPIQKPKAVPPKVISKKAVPPNVVPPKKPSGFGKMVDGKIGKVLAKESGGKLGVGVVSLEDRKYFKDVGIKKAWKAFRGDEGT